MENRSIASICEAIDDLIITQIEARPGGSDRQMRILAGFARDLQGGMTEPAAAAVRGGIENAGCAVVSSGWVIEGWYPRGELCGMIGTIGLARFFVNGLQKPVLFPTEEEIVPVVQALCRSAGLRVAEWDKFAGSDFPQVCIVPFPKTDPEAQAETARIIEHADPGALITVEKCGPSPSGVFHTGIGVDMTRTTARLNLLVEGFKAANIPTVGVGDLGNEIGFGLIRDQVLEVYGDIAACHDGCGDGWVTSTATDFLVVGAASNRAAMGLEAALGAVMGVPEHVRGADVDTRLIKDAVTAGALDSFTVSPTLTDGHGVPAVVNGALTDILRYMAGTASIQYPLFKARD